MAVKKDFKQSAAGQFFNLQTKEADQPKTEQEPAVKDDFLSTDARASRAEANKAYITPHHFTRPRQKPETGEARSKRLNLIIKPSVYERVAAIADVQGISFNHITELALIEYAENHSNENNQ